ncbi:hypothetical protein PMAYCL1PPCAC_17963 [Pristionchus mayeri]|uniref:Copper transport protein n=1 Tax=Pristionchus mayeri TaxID=1317129 RepID=A0AAN5CNN7_9BILA|nr:hypothetical protein PMAYCL1PPCAC_17963 [Pristionchus mayeri]
MELMDMDMDMNKTDNHPHMQMYFHFRENEPILFWEWLPADTTGYVFSCIGIALLSLAYEFLRFLRFKSVLEVDLIRDCSLQSAENCCCDDGETQPILVKERSHISSLHNAHHIADSLLFFVQLYGSYTLMLVWMTYNVPIVISSSLGHIFGHLLFGPLMTYNEEKEIGDCCA